MGIKIDITLTAAYFLSCQSWRNTHGRRSTNKDAALKMLGYIQEVFCEAAEGGEVAENEHAMRQMMSPALRAKYTGLIEKVMDCHARGENPADREDLVRTAAELDASDEFWDAYTEFLSQALQDDETFEQMKKDLENKYPKPRPN